MPDVCLDASQFFRAAENGQGFRYPNNAMDASTSVSYPNTRSRTRRTPANGTFSETPQDGVSLGELFDDLNQSLGSASVSSENYRDEQDYSGVSGSMLKTRIL